MNKSVLPFGPYHEYLPEPVHFTLELHGSRIAEVTPGFGFMHRGIERQAEGLRFADAVPVMEKVCGRCGFFHAQALCVAAEEAAGVEISYRARALRMTAGELVRARGFIDSLMWTFRAIGSERYSSLAHSREKLADMIELATGRRYLTGFNVPGGVSRDISADSLLKIHLMMFEIQEDLKTAEWFINNEPVMRSRLHGVGVLSRETAAAECVVGVTARSSGLAVDVRSEDVMYEEAGFKMLTGLVGDSMARVRLRMKELLRSLELVEFITSNMPDGAFRTEFPAGGAPFKPAETVVRVEQTGGELAMYVGSDEAGEVNKISARSATAANMAAATAIMKGAELEDVPVILSSMDICIPCFDK